MSPGATSSLVESTGLMGGSLLWTALAILLYKVSLLLLSPTSFPEVILFPLGFFFFFQIDWKRSIGLHQLQYAALEIAIIITIDPIPAL